MKHLIVILMTVFMSFSTSALAATANSTESKIDLTSFVIPTNITVKQTITFKDGKTNDVIAFAKSVLKQFV